VVLPLRRRIVEGTQLHVNAMDLSVFALLQARQSEIEAGRRYLEAVRDYWIARAGLERTIGGLFPVPAAP
jgi:cobalt-zinc-cadmium efflux system outer membrane protein